MELTLETSTFKARATHVALTAAHISWEVIRYLGVHLLMWTQNVITGIFVLVSWWFSLFSRSPLVALFLLIGALMFGMHYPKLLGLEKPNAESVSTTSVHKLVKKR